MRESLVSLLRVNRMCGLDNFKKEGVVYGLQDDKVMAIGIDTANCPKHINILDGVDAIADYAFNGTDIKSVFIPPSVTHIGWSAFANCRGLEQVLLSDGLKTIGTTAFERTAITAVKIPQTVEHIPHGAFSGCSVLREVDLAEGLQTIGDFTFCTAWVKDITFPSTLVKIGTGAFHSCDMLESLTFLGKIPTVGKNAFKKTSLKTVTVHRMFSPWARKVFGRGVKLIRK